MVWNYRVIMKTSYMLSGEKQVEYGIYEAYYDDHDKDKVTSWSANPVAIYGETLEELKQVYEIYGLALSKPVLIWDDLERELVALNDQG